jgi:hypothetical protein
MSKCILLTVDNFNSDASEGRGPNVEYQPDRLRPEYCVPHPGHYTRLSEMLADGWVITAMCEHPMLRRTLSVAVEKR